MKEFCYVIHDELGLHARPAGLLVRLASGFGCDIRLAVGTRTANAKQIMSVMLLAAKQGQELTVICDGADEERAEAEIRALFTSEKL